MNPKELAKVIRASLDPDRFAIMKALQVSGNMNYNHLKEYVKFDERKGFPYHLRSLLKLKIVEKHDESRAYYLTSRGLKLIKMAEAFLKEKYITEDVAEICTNADDGTHIFMEVCKRCSYIRKKIS